jgi:hypothetical protein
LLDADGNGTIDLEEFQQLHIHVRIRSWTSLFVCVVCVVQAPFRVSGGKPLIALFHNFIQPYLILHDAKMDTHTMKRVRSRVIKGLWGWGLGWIETTALSV